MNLPKLNESIKQHFNLRAKALEEQAILFSPTANVWQFAKDVQADSATVMSAGGRLPFELTYFSFENLDSFSLLKPLFPGALCEQLTEHSYAVHYIYVHHDKSFASWFPFSIHVDMSTGNVTDVFEDDWTPTEADDPVNKAIHFSFSLIVKLVAMLNCKNLFFDQQIERVAESVNRKRVRKGKRPLFEHRTLNIDFGKQGTSVMRNVASPGVMRAHLVRGHFKQRKTGLFWWSPFARGNATHGIVDKEYSLSKTS